MALMVAARLDVEFFHAERFEQPQNDALFSVQHHIPPSLRPRARGKRAAVVNDVINASSVTRGTYADLLPGLARRIISASWAVPTAAT